MKRKIFNTLKHKLQWLVLLTALLGMSQGVWAWTVFKVHGQFGTNKAWTTSSNKGCNGSYTTPTLAAGTYEFGIKADNDQWLANGNTYTSSSTYQGIYKNGGIMKLTLSTSGTVTITNTNCSWDNGNGMEISITFNTSCSTPSNSDISITAPSSATTLYLGSGSAPSVTQTVTATCSKGNTYSWESNHPTYNYTSAFSPGSGTMTNVSFTSSSSTSTTATFKHEGVYTATFKAGCSNTTDASKNAPTITVKPGHIYFDGPFFSGSGYDLTKQHVEINKSTDQFVYEWTAAYTSGDFVISVGNACNSFATSAYTIGNYAEITTTGVSMAESGNHNFSPNIGTISVGDRLRLTVEYTGLNASNIPHYNVTLEKFCNGAPMQSIVDILDGTKVWFYAGILSSWNQSQIKCKLSSTDNGPYDLSSTQIDICTSTKAKIAAVNLPSANYCLHHPDWTDGCVNMGENAVAGKIYVLGKNFCSSGDVNAVKTKSGISLSNLKFDNGSGGTTKTVEKGSDVSIFAQSATTTNPWGNGLKIKYYVKKSGESTYYTECDWEASVANTTGTTGTLDTDNLSAGTYTVYALLMNTTSEEEAVKASTTLTLTINSCTPPEASNFTVASNTYTYEYDGNPHSATVTGVSPYSPDNIVAYYGANSSTTATSQTNADAYYIYVHSADAYGSYCAVTSTIATALATQLVINPVTPSSSNYSKLFSISGTGSHAYTGESQSVAVAWKSPYTGCEGAITVKYNNSTTAPTNVGVYPITISVAAGTNNNASASDISVGTLTITAISPGLALGDITNKCGTGDYALSSTSNSAGAVTYSVTSGNAEIVNGTTLRVNATGDVTVKASQVADGNYTAQEVSETYSFASAPVAGFSASAGSSTLNFSNTAYVSTTLNTAANSNWDFQWVCDSHPTWGSNNTPTIVSTTSNSTEVRFPIEGVYTFHVGARCKNKNDDSYVNSTTVTVTVSLPLCIKGPLTASDGDWHSYSLISNISDSNTRTYSFTAYNKGTNIREFVLNASTYVDDDHDYYHIHTSSTVGNHLTLTGLDYNSGNDYNLRALESLGISESGTPVVLTITHNGGYYYNLSLALDCTTPDAKTISISASSVCEGESANVIVGSSQSGYIYTVYDSNSGVAGSGTGDGSNLNISVTPSSNTTYTVKAKQGSTCSETAMSNTVSVTVNQRPTFSPASGITQYLPVTVTSDASSPSWTFNKESGSLDGAWLSNTDESVTIFKAPTGTYTVSDGTCATGSITVSDDTETCD